jgi:hypothetical protein
MSMTTDQQLDLLTTLLGDGDDSNNARWSATQKLSFLNMGRRRVSELTRCVQVRDSQDTVDGTRFYSITNDVISFYEVECGGRPIRLVRPEDWRDVVGRDDTLQGTPAVAMYNARQLQLYYVPKTVETLRYHGWGYAADLVAAGVDADFLQPAQEASIYLASALAKKADERNSEADETEARTRMSELERQFRRRGARYVREQTIARRQIV